MLQIKPGVSLHDPDGAASLSPLMVPALIAAHAAFQEAGHPFIITSALEGEHSPRSRHYHGLAFDCRTRHLPNGVADRLAAILRRDLAACYDVVLEATHIHVEWEE